MSVGYDETTWPVDWAEHESRAGHLLRGSPADLARGRADLSPAVAGSVLALMLRTILASSVATEHQSWFALALSRFLSEAEEPPWSVDRNVALELTRLACLGNRMIEGDRDLVLVIEMLGRAKPFSGLEAQLVMALAVDLSIRRDLASGEASRLRRLLFGMLDPAPPTDRYEPTLVASDRWSVQVLASLPVDDDPAVAQLLDWLASASGSKPSARWLAAVAGCLNAPAAKRALRVMLERLQDVDRVGTGMTWENTRQIVERNNVDLARAALWATIALDESWVEPILVDMLPAGDAEYTLICNARFDSIKPTNAVVLALGERGTTTAITELMKLKRRIRHNGLRTRIDLGLERAAEKVGLTKAELTERTVPTGVLDAAGSALFSNGESRARVTLTSGPTLSVAWLTSSGEAPKPTAAADKSEISAIKREIKKELRETLDSEVHRLEELFAADRSWPVEEWRQYYLDHPITRTIATRLIWRFDQTSGIPVDRAAILTPDGAITLPDSGTVRLWHPATQDLGEVQAWRSWLVNETFRQPFKQVFREVYLLTDAERTTSTYSHRFAGHVVRYNQLYALFKVRGWPANYLGDYDGGCEGRARRNFEADGITAVFDHGQLGDGSQHDVLGRVELAGSGRVWFHRTGQRAKEPIPTR